MWHHFETFHILHTPTYASKYPPAQGLFLAVGQVLYGAPIAGAWLSLALAASGIGWMLRAWFSPGWSFLGGLLLGLRPQVSYWGDCYFGGAVPLLGGALVLGAVPRLCRENRARDGLALVFGLLLLANSRPYEGLLFSLVPLGTLLVHRFWSRRDRLGLAPWRVLLPSAALLACGGAFMGIYNARVTGDPVSLPYRLYEKQYSYVPLFSWGELRTPPPYRHEVIRHFYKEFAEGTFNMTSVSPSRWWFKLRLIRYSVIGPLLGLALVIPLLVAVLRPPCTMWLPLASCIAVLAGNLAAAWVWPHYFAPALGALFVLVTSGFRRLMAMRFRGRPFGAAVVVFLLISASAEYATRYAQVFRAVKLMRHSGVGLRANLEMSLERTPERDLVIVRYGSSHGLEEWVYNHADIDASHVVWAREMDAASNRKLLSHFRDRKAWLLMPDEHPIRLVPYSNGTGPVSPAESRSPSLDPPVPGRPVQTP
jgi:hypothetical protein